MRLTEMMKKMKTDEIRLSGIKAALVASYDSPFTISVRLLSCCSRCSTIGRGSRDSEAAARGYERRILG